MSPAPPKARAARRSAGSRAVRSALNSMAKRPRPASPGAALPSRQRALPSKIRSARSASGALRLARRLSALGPLHRGLLLVRLGDEPVGEDVLVPMQEVEAGFDGVGVVGEHEEDGEALHGGAIEL